MHPCPSGVTGVGILARVEDARPALTQCGCVDGSCGSVRWRRSLFISHGDTYSYFTGATLPGRQPHGGVGDSTGAEPTAGFASRLCRLIEQVIEALVPRCPHL